MLFPPSSQGLLCYQSPGWECSPVQAESPVCRSGMVETRDHGRHHQSTAARGGVRIPRPVLWQPRPVGLALMMAPHLLARWCALWWEHDEAGKRPCVQECVYLHSSLSLFGAPGVGRGGQHRTPGAHRAAPWRSPWSSGQARSRWGCEAGGHYFSCRKAQGNSESRSSERPVHPGSLLGCSRVYDANVQILAPCQSVTLRGCPREPGGKASLI